MKHIAVALLVLLFTRHGGNRFPPGRVPGMVELFGNIRMSGALAARGRLRILDPLRFLRTPHNPPVTCGARSRRGGPS